ncbi:hypothetical protein LEMLEM_LOCUS25009, partial [Lemmus lemmus]
MKKEKKDKEGSQPFSHQPRVSRGSGLSGIRHCEGMHRASAASVLPGPSFPSLGPHGTPYSHVRGTVTESDGGQAAFVALLGTMKKNGLSLPVAIPVCH